LFIKIFKRVYVNLFYSFTARLANTTFINYLTTILQLKGAIPNFLTSKIKGQLMKHFHKYAVKKVVFYNSEKR